ncbi:glycosyltransferase family 39 protein [Methanobrevibacter sp. DSM 116169]|uniref:glycosyltransferase family 39 protein n=1 Tax=Methanobrevibacter sp. DSM 116169 TaxID=3242727 RepID=UPI0038FC421E
MALNIKKDYPYLIILIIFSSILITYLINFNLNFGIFCSDVYVYLLNALYFTGENIRSTSTISLSPIICYLTSLLFEIGFKHQIAIFMVTGLFAIFGFIGLFLLLKTRFNNLLSLLATVIFISFSLNLAWLANGSIDIPAVSLTLWAMLFLILALDKNPKYFILTILLFLLAFFIRTTVILFLPVLIFYYLSKKNFIANLLLNDKFKRFKAYLFSKEFKYILIGLLISLVLFIIISYKITKMGDTVVFLGQSSNAITGTRQGIGDPAYNTDILFYIKNLTNFLSSSHVTFLNHKLILKNPTFISYAYIVLFIAGIILIISNYYKKFKDFKIKTNYKHMILIILMIFLTIISFNNVSSFITLILCFLTLLITDFIFKKYNFKYLSLNLAFLGWILFNLIFFSYLDIKVDRYFIACLVGITYFIVSAFYLIQVKFPKREKLFNGIYIIIILILMISSFNFVNTYEDTDEFKNEESISIFLKNYDEDYKNKTIGSYNVRYYSWYLLKYVEAYPSQNQTKIDNSDLDYYISNKTQDLDNFKEIKNIGTLYVYERI